VFATLQALGFKGGLALESFVNMPPEIACTLSVWRSVASAEAEVMETGLPFLRNKARRYGLIRTPGRAGRDVLAVRNTTATLS